MKIYGEGPVRPQLHGQGIGSEVTVKKVSEEQAQAQKGIQSSGEDRIEISERARESARLMEEIRTLPDIREEKIQTLKKAIETGNYRIDYSKLAEKILNEI